MLLISLHILDCVIRGDFGCHVPLRQHRKNARICTGAALEAMQIYHCPLKVLPYEQVIFNSGYSEYGWFVRKFAGALF